MAEMSNNDPQFEIYKQRLIDEVKKGNLVMIKALAKKNPQLLNSLDGTDITLLHFAASHQSVNVIEWLLSDEGRAAGFNSVLAKAGENTTALHLAIKFSDLECVKAIVYGCKVENGEREEMLNGVTDQGFSVLYIAALGRYLSVIKWLLSDKKGGGREAGFHRVLAVGEETRFTALHALAEQGNLDCFTAIVEGCKVENGERKDMLNAVTHERRTVLHYAAQFGHLPITRWLLSKGRGHGFASSFAKDDHNMTALHLAVQAGNLEICKAIVDGCKVENGEREEMLNVVIVDGLTSLHLAALTAHRSIVSWLLSDRQRGGRTLGFNKVLTTTDVGTSTALHLAIQQGHLETCKAIVNGCKVENGEREKMLNALNENGATVLHNAVRFCRSDVVTWLLSHDADGGRANGLKSKTITAVSVHSHSALNFAARSRSVETLRALLSGCTVGERLKLFLAVDVKGWTPLHCAAQYLEPATIRELLLHHPETKMIVDHRDHRGMTALHRAALDGGFDEESKNEWTDWKKGANPNCAPREEVVAALLTYEYDEDDQEEEEEGKDEAATSIKGRKQQQQQAAFIDVNLRLKIEMKEK